MCGYKDLCCRGDSSVPRFGHAAAQAEESRLTEILFAVIKILRFAQEDKWGLVGMNAFHFVRRGRRLDDPLFLPLGGRWLLP